MTDRLARLERLARRERDLSARELAWALTATDQARAVRSAVARERLALPVPGPGVHRLAGLRLASEARAVAGLRLERADARVAQAEEREGQARDALKSRQQTLRQWERLGARRRELAAKARRRAAQREADARCAPESSP